MTELYPDAGELNALSGLSDAQQEVLYPAVGESPYYTSFYKMLYRMLDVARRAGDLRVFKDGDLTFGVRAGRFAHGSQGISFAGASGQVLADNALNWIYLGPDGVLTAATNGFPATPHLPLATIATGSQSAAGQAGAYAHGDIADLRGEAIYRPVGGSVTWLGCLSAAPAGQDGDMYKDTTLGQVRLCAGGNWVTLG